MRFSIGMYVLATAACLSACEAEPAPAIAGDVDLRDYLMAPGAGAGGEIAFTVDSTIFDPAADGTSVITSTQTWTLEPLGSDADDERRFLVDKRRDGSPAGRQFWRWGLINEGAGLVNELDGVPYLSLVEPFVVGAEWDPLALTDPDLIVPIRAEPIAVHKDWSGRIDSVGMYSGPGGVPIEAIYVSHANSENRIELRRVSEVYGRNFGLLARDVDILDSQQLGDLPWDEKAERGFRLRVRRVF